MKECGKVALRKLCYKGKNNQNTVVVVILNVTGNRNQTRQSKKVKKEVKAKQTIESVLNRRIKEFYE